MNFARDVLTPESLTMLQTIAQLGSFAAAARDMGLVPSALSYRVRQMEESLDVLLFDLKTSDWSTGGVLWSEKKPSS